MVEIWGVIFQFVFKIGIFWKDYQVIYIVCFLGLIIFRFLWEVEVLLNVFFKFLV